VDAEILSRSVSLENASWAEKQHVCSPTRTASASSSRWCISCRPTAMSWCCCGMAAVAMASSACGQACRCSAITTIAKASMPPWSWNARTYRVGTGGSGSTRWCGSSTSIRAWPARAERLCLFNLSARPRTAGRGSSTQVLDSRERVRACTGPAIEENHRKWFSSQALSAPPAVACTCRWFQAGGLQSTGMARMDNTLRLGLLCAACTGLLLVACSQQSGSPAPTAEQQKAQADTAAAAGNLATYRQLLKLHNDEMVVTMGKDIVSRFPGSDAAKEVEQTLPAIEKRYEANREKNRLAGLWTYQVAPMAGGTQSTASIYSTRAGDSDPVRLVLRRHTSWGQSAFLYGSKPGFLCRGNCTITGKADGKPVRIKAFTPQG